MNSEDLKQDCILAWYDGPLIQTSRDKDNNLYIEYNNWPDYILSKVTVKLILKMINNEVSVADCFNAGSKKWKWDKEDYKEISEINPDDLMDNNVYFNDICYLDRITYIDELEKELNNESV